MNQPFDYVHVLHPNGNIYQLDYVNYKKCCGFPIETELRFYKKYGHLLKTEDFSVQEIGYVRCGKIEMNLSVYEIEFNGILEVTNV